MRRAWPSSCQRCFEKSLFSAMDEPCKGQRAIVRQQNMTDAADCSILGLLRAEILQPINLLSRTINDSTDNDRSRQGYPSSTNYRYTDKSAFSSLETLRIGLACPSG